MFELSLSYHIRIQTALSAFQNGSILFPPVNQLVSFSLLTNFTIKIFHFTLSYLKELKLANTPGFPACTKQTLGKLHAMA